MYAQEHSDNEAARAIVFVLAAREWERTRRVLGALVGDRSRRYLRLIVDSTIIKFSAISIATHRRCACDLSTASATSWAFSPS